MMIRLVMIIAATLAIVAIVKNSNIKIISQYLKRVQSLEVLYQFSSAYWSEQLQTGIKYYK